MRPNLFQYRRFGFTRSLEVVLCVLLLLAASPHRAHSEDSQLWLDGEGHKSLATHWSYKVSPIYRTELEPDGWTTLGLRNTFIHKHRSWFTPSGSVDGYYTVDPDSPTIVELRLWVAVKFTYPKYIHAIHLSKPYCSLRLEQRFLWYPDSDSNDQKTRLRLKAGGTFLFRNAKMTQGTIYVPWYIEGFHNFNGVAFEYSAAKDRISIGLGYVFDARWRGEFDYIAQGTINSIEHSREKTDNIFQ